MLRQLHIQNYALIDALEIQFSEGLNIITGETGAGKSILLGALSLVLGERADSSVMRDPAKKCVVEAYFQIGSSKLEAFFEEHELDHEALSIIRREISPSGKSRAFINDTPVTLVVLRSLVAQLVDLNRQHDTLELNTRDFQFLLLDALAGNQAVLLDYRSSFDQWRMTKKKARKLREEQALLSQEQDYIQFQLNELDEAELEDTEELERLEAESAKSEHAAQIQEALAKAHAILSGAEINASELLGDALQQLRSVSNYDPESAKLAERLESSRLELSDIADETERLAGQTDLDEERQQWLRDRLDLLNNLIKKHHCADIQALIELRETYRSKWKAVSGFEEQLKQLDDQTETLYAGLLKQAEQLRKARLLCAPKLERDTIEKLAQLGIPSASFNVVLEETEADEFGMDRLQFTFSANKGIKAEPIAKVASGGELSRLMLSLKSMIAAETSLPCLIFDEIDTGVSGEVALQLGSMMEALGKAHQLIAITHLPQIAAKGQSHFFVFKLEDEERSSTQIKKLTFDERKIELAKMLSGDNYSQAALENATQLLN